MTRRTTLLAASALTWGVVLLATSHAGPDERRAAADVAQAPRPTPPASSPAIARVRYADDVLPILTENCLECHSQEKRKGGLSLESYSDLLAGGKDGPVVRPGNSAGSLIVDRITGVGGDQMPKDGVPLSSGQIALIKRWIDEGARPAPSAPPAPPPWEAPLALSVPPLPPVVWRDWTSPGDRAVAAYLQARGTRVPVLAADAVFVRRAYLDLWGLLPTPEQAQAFAADRSADKRRVLVTRLLADGEKYAEHWMTFWNDLLRNEDGVNYYSEDGARRSITPWLLEALRGNLPYDRFVSALLNPTEPGDPDGFLIGVNWRGETSAAVTPWMQASQNAAQIFLGVNLKCNACHDSFISRWKLKDAYALAGFFAPEGRLQLYRCDIPQNEYAEPAFLYPELNRTAPSASLADRRRTVAAIFTDPGNGRLPRTIVNRVWQRLLGAGLVAVPDEMDGRPWSPVLLDWLASDFAAHRYDLKHLISEIVLSRAYQMPTVARSADVPAQGYVFAGPEVRRLTAEQFADAIGSMTGEWSVSRLNIGRGQGAAGAARGAAVGTAARGAGAGTAGARGAGPGSPAAGAGAGAAGGAAATAGAAGRGAAAGTMPSEATTAGQYVREWRMPSTRLSRALGRPVRDQVTSVRAIQATTPQALEVVNGEILNRWLLLGARRLLGQDRPAPPSLYNRAVAGRQARPVTFEINIANVQTLRLLVQEQGSNDPERVSPVWARAELIGANGAITLLGALSPVDPAGLRPGTGTVMVGTAPADAVRVRNPSVLRYDLTGRGFTLFRGVMWLENAPGEIGATLDPQVRFYVFGDEPDFDRLVPPVPGVPLPAPVPVATATQAVDRVFRHALGRAPSAQERRLAEAALGNPARPSAEGLADLLWALVMKPEFQLIY